METAWSPDGKTVVFPSKQAPGGPYALFRVDVQTLETRPLTTPLQNQYGDVQPAFSPDQKWLAFIRWSGDSDLFMVNLEDGALHRLTTEQQRITSLAWSGDGKHLYYSSDRSGYLAIWKLPARGGEPIRTNLDVDASALIGLTLSEQAERMIYAKFTYDFNIREMSVSAAPGQPSSDSVLIASTRWDSNPQFSPDGNNIAFLSNRQGRAGLWVCSARGGEPRLVASFEGVLERTPRWSPDGKQIAFGNGWAIYVVPVQGGPVRQITDDLAQQKEPIWSNDGRWIFFTSERSGMRQVWKVTPEGEGLTQVTEAGGTALFVSADDTHLYYLKPGTPGIWRITLGQADETLAYAFPDADKVMAWAATPDGLYFIKRQARRTIEYLDFAEGVFTQLLSSPKELMGLTVLPETGRLLYARADGSDSDLMLVEFVH